MTVQELKAVLEGTGAKPLILDVREPWEVNICALPCAKHIPMGQVPARLDELNAELGDDQELIVMCHHGVRSQRVCYFLAHQGFSKLHNLHGGIDAWAREIEPGMAKY